MSQTIAPRFKAYFRSCPPPSTTRRARLESQKRAVDFMIDAGSNGICILANFSEQFALSDEERERSPPPSSSTSPAACR